MIKRIKNKHLLSSKTNDVSKNPIRVLYKSIKKCQVILGT